MKVATGPHVWTFCKRPLPQVSFELKLPSAPICAFPPQCWIAVYWNFEKYQSRDGNEKKEAKCKRFQSAGNPCFPVFDVANRNRKPENGLGFGIRDRKPKCADNWRSTTQQKRYLGTTNPKRQYSGLWCGQVDECVVGYVACELILF